MTLKFKRGISALKFIGFVVLPTVSFIVFYIFSLRGRVGFTDWSRFNGYYYAHRGFYNKTDTPENSRAAFEKALNNGYGIELDVHLLSDGGLAVIHDSSLLRTAGVNLKVENLKTEDLKKYFLEGTDEKVPTFSQVLSLIKGQVPIIIDIKTSDNNVEILCKRICEELKDYSGAYCIESFDPRCIYWFAKNKPDITRGQLFKNTYKSKDSNTKSAERLLIAGPVTNFLTRPDFIAYRFSERDTISNKICTKFWKMQGVGWTITDKKDMSLAKGENIFPVFENILP